MKTTEAISRNQMNMGKEKKVFDWDKAAQMIKDSGTKSAAAGLSNDWEWTGGSIFENGKPDMDSYTYLSSQWAIPEIEIDGELHDCFKMKSEVPDWGSYTKWPDSALAIINNIKTQKQKK